MLQVAALIEKIADAIIRQEGEPYTSTNPGNLRGAPWITPLPTIVNGGIVNGFWKPATRAIGEAGLVHLVALHVAQGNSLEDFIGGHPGVYAGFAPGADGNKPNVYIENVVKWVGEQGITIDPTQPLWNYIEIELPT